MGLRYSYFLTGTLVAAAAGFAPRPLCRLPLVPSPSPAVSHHHPPVRHVQRVAFSAGGSRSRSTQLASKSATSLEAAEENGLSFNSQDWFRNIQNIGSSRILAQIQSHLVANTAWAGIVAVFYEVGGYSDAVSDQHISTIPHSIMAGALALLLVFRNNAAYDRFWEARKIWGCCTNSCRSLARLALSTLCREERMEVFLEYVKAFPYSLKQRLQQDASIAEMSFLNLEDDEIEAIVRNRSPPLYILQRLTQILALDYEEVVEAHRDVQAQIYRSIMEQEVVRLTEQIGMAERILSTPVPRSYSLHTSRLLSVYLFTLPPVLVSHTELYTPIIVGLVCWGLLAIEAIAYDIEEPFNRGDEKTSLPLEKYAERIRRDVDTFVDNRNNPLPEPALKVESSDWRSYPMDDKEYYTGRRR